MGESDRSHRSEIRPQKRRHFLSGTQGSAVLTLFSVNAVFYLILMMIRVGVLAGEHDDAYFFTHVMQWFELPADLNKLSSRPWTIITYMFSENGAGLIRIISNMIWLWAFGSLLQQMAGNDKVVPVYIYGGLAGAVFFIASFYVIGPLIPVRDSFSLIGANAATMAVAMAATTLQPGFRFFRQLGGGIPIWVLMAIYLVIDFAGVAKISAGYSLSHLGGAVAGFVFILFLKQGRDGSIWMHRLYNYIINLFEPAKKINPAKNKIFYNTGDRKPFEKSSNITQKKLDEILDKINHTGYDSLTADEKAFLKKASEDDNL